SSPAAARSLAARKTSMAMNGGTWPRLAILIVMTSADRPAKRELTPAAEVADRSARKGGPGGRVAHLIADPRRVADVEHAPGRPGAGTGHQHPARRRDRKYHPHLRGANLRRGRARSRH